MGLADGNLLTQAEYARHRGCSRTSVSKAVAEGRISTMPDGRINPVLADVEWAQNTRARAGSEPRSAPSALAAAAAMVGQRRDDGGDSGDGRGDYWEARGRREAAEAELAELKLAEARGELVRVADIRAAFSRKAAGLREALLQIPARLGPVLAAEADAGKVHDLLQDELRQVLQQVVEA